MQERPLSVIMPGAYHVDDSAYLTVYYKSDYIFCVLVEKPVTERFDIKNFEYYQYDVDQGNPEFLFTADEQQYRIPREKLDSKDFFIDRKQELNKAGYKEVFSGEVELGSLCVLDEDITVIGKYFRFSDLGHLSVGGVWSFNRDSNGSPSARFETGLKQLQSGMCVDEMIIDMSMRNKRGRLGEGCILAIAEALKSGSCIHLEKLIIDLSGNANAISKNSEAILEQALNSPRCPVDLEFKITKISPGGNDEKCYGSSSLKLTPQTKVMINLVNMFQCFKQHNYPLDILVYITIILEIDTQENRIFNHNGYSALLFRRNSNIIELGLEVRQLKSSLLEAISGQLCQELNFGFNVGVESWRMLTATLLQNIESEIKTVLQDIFQNITSVQSTILLRHIRNKIDIHQFTDNMAGSIKKAESVDVITGAGLVTSGLTQLYFSAIETKKLASSFYRVTTNGNSTQEVQYASCDELKGGSTGKIERRNQVILLFYKTIAKKATLEQLDILISDSMDKNSNSKIMKLLGSNKAIQSEYQNCLVELKERKQVNTNSLTRMKNRI